MNYNADSIEKLTFREGARKRIGIYLDSATMDGVVNGLLELVNNSTDEFIVYPQANIIEIEIGENWASCKDKGRGMPRGKNKFSNEVMIDLLTENHSGAKFNENSYGGKSRGLNGTGSAATCVSSDWFEVTSKRDGFEWFLRFENGIPLTKEAIKGKPTKETGTYIKYKPSQEVFRAEEIKFNFEKICDIIEEYSYFNKGIKFIVKDAINNKEKEFFSKNGLVDFAKVKIKEPIHDNPIYTNITENDIDVEIICQWTKGYENFYLFTNGAENPDGGTPITGIKTAITRNINKTFKSDFSGDTARKGLIYIISIKLKDPIYNGQTKTKINNPELRSLVDKAFSEAFMIYKQKFPQDLEKIEDFLTREEKAEKAAQRAREVIMNQIKETQVAAKKKVIFAEKLKDCEEHGENSMLVLTEGDSALGAMAQARPTDKIALYPLRGKIINALKNDLEKVLENNEVKDITILLGAGILDHYNPKKLRYGKVGIATDGDADGFNIMCLIVTLFYILMPEFLKEGRLHWLRAPLYRIDTKDKTFFCFTEEDRIKKEKEIKGTKYSVGYIKGLGELSPIDTQKAFFSDEARLERMIIKDPQTFLQIDALMGSDIEPRRDFIFNNIDFSKVVE